MASVVLSAERERRTENVFHMLLITAGEIVKKKLKIWKFVLVIFCGHL